VPEHQDLGIRAPFAIVRGAFDTVWALKT